MSEYYLVFPSVGAENFNANAGAYIAGVPQPTAVCGLSHAFCLAWDRLRPNELETNFCSTIYSISSYSGLQGQSRNPKSQYYQKQNVSKSPSAAMTDRPRASMKFSLIMKISLKDDCDLLSDSTFESDMTDILQSLRFNGASLWVDKTPVFKTNKQDALKCLPANGFILSDETSLLESWLTLRKECLNLKDNDDLTVAKAIADFCARNTDHEVYKPRYVPVIAGVNRLTSLQAISGIRHDYLHAFAEPVIGLARFRSVSSVRRAYKNASEDDQFDIDLPDGQTTQTSCIPGIFWSYANVNSDSNLHLTCGYQ